MLYQSVVVSHRKEILNPFEVLMNRNKRYGIKVAEEFLELLEFLSQKNSCTQIKEMAEVIFSLYPNCPRNYPNLMAASDTTPNHEP